MAYKHSVWQIKGTYIEVGSPTGYDVLIKGNNKYLNFGTTTGNLGYGIRDNGGAMEIKDSGGTWRPIEGTQISEGTADGQMAYWDDTAGGWKHTETTELSWDDSNKRLGLNQASPRERLDIIDTSGVQARLTYTDNSVYTNIGTDSSGHLTISPTGDQVDINAADINLDATQNRGLYWGSRFNTFKFDATFGPVYLSGGSNAIVMDTNDNSPNAYFAVLEGDTDVISATELMRITKSGDMGINTTSPREKLDIIDTSGIQARFSYSDNSVYTNVGTNSSGQFVISPSGLRTINDGALTISDNTLLATPVAGTFEFDDDRMYLTNVDTQRAIDRTSDVITSTTEVVNTTTETTIFTGTLDSDDLKVGNLLKMYVGGEISNASAADDITIRIKIGSTTIETFNPAIGNVAGADWFAELRVVVRTVGASGTIADHSIISINGDDSIENDDSTSLDTTTAQNITVTVQWDAAKAGNTISAYIGYLEFKN